MTRDRKVPWLESRQADRPILVYELMENMARRAETIGSGQPKRFFETATRGFCEL